MSYEFLVLILEFLGCIIFSLYLINYYIKKDTHIIILIISILTWICTFSLMIILPHDVAVSRRIALEKSNDNDNSFADFILSCYKKIYWAMFSMTWIFVPFLQKYEKNGNLTFSSKFIYSIKNNLLIYGIGLSIGIISFIIARFASNKYTISVFINLCIELSNVLGLFIVIFLLGYSIVRVPKDTFFHQNYQSRIHFLEWRFYKIIQLLRDKQKKIVEKAIILEKTMKIVESEDNEISKYEKEIENIYYKFVEFSKNMHFKIYEGELSNYEGVRTEKKLNQLNQKIKKYETQIVRLNYQKGQVYYNWLLFKSILYFNSELNERYRNSNLLQNDKENFFIDYDKDTNKLIFHPKHLNEKKIEHYIINRPYFFIIFSIIFTILSIFTLISETTFSLNWKLSPFGYLIRNTNNLFILHLVTLIPVLYLFYLSFYSVFSFKISGFCGMYGDNQTDSISILFVDDIMCKIAVALCLNIIQMIRNDIPIKLNDGTEITIVTIIEKQYGTVAYSGIYKKFAVFYPIVIAVLAALNLTNFFGKFGNNMEINNYEADSVDNKILCIKKGNKLLLELNNKYWKEKPNEDKNKEDEIKRVELEIIRQNTTDCFLSNKFN